MRNATVDDYINFSILILYAGLMGALIVSFEWIRQIRKDGKKSSLQDVFKQMMVSIGLNDITDDQVHLLMESGENIDLIQEKKKATEEFENPEEPQRPFALSIFERNNYRWILDLWKIKLSECRNVESTHMSTYCSYAILLFTSYSCPSCQWCYCQSTRLVKLMKLTYLARWSQ